MTLRIHLLGPLEVHGDGGPLAFPARKTAGLLAVLALRAGVAFEREWLTALLWPDVPEAQGRTSLRQALGHLRKQLGESSVVSSGDKIHLDPAQLWVDVAELERVLDRAPALRAPALEWCRGGLLATFPALEEPFDDWLGSQRARLRETTAARLEECLAALAASGELERACAVAACVLELDPTRESAHRALMRLHAERGDRSAALRQYARCRELLKSQLDIEPSAATEALRSTIAAPQPASAARSQEPAVLPTQALGGRTLLAVVPFQAVGTDSDAQLLASALSEDVTTELARFPQLGLIARSSVAAIAARSRDPDVIARESGARLVLSGSVLVRAEKARVTAALVDPTTLLELWSERWEVPLTDLFAIVDQLTRSLVGALALRIDESRLLEARKKPPERLEVYECWLRGLECLRRGTPDSDSEARHFFERALDLAPHFGRAYSGISLSHFNEWSCQAWDQWDLRERLAFENARRAVELDAADPVTHCILARIHVYRREFELGQRHLERALELNPHDTDLLVHAALALAQLGEPDRACELAEHSLRLNPKHPDWYCAAAAFPCFVARRLDDCIRYGSRAPDAFVDTRALLAAAHAHRGELDAAREHAARFVQQFQLKICATLELASERALLWLLQVNPLLRPADEAYLRDGLRLAGVGSS